METALKRSASMLAISILLQAALATSACKSVSKDDEQSTSVSTESDIRAGFNEMLDVTEGCDPARFLEAHTQKARGAMEAIDRFVDLSEMGLDQAATNPGARWACELGRLAGFGKSNVQVVQVVMNAKIGTARVVFTMRDREYGFPMMRQFGKWRAPFPGFIFLASEFRDWQKAIQKALPDQAKWPDLATRLGKAITMLEPFQPNWAEFPDMAPKVD
jgi:hypothetical protein